MLEYFNSFIDIKSCQRLIYLAINTPKEFSFFWEGRFCSTSEFLCRDKTMLYNLFKITKKVSQLYKKDLYPEYLEVVRWEDGISQPVHLDIGRNTTFAASITYLNNNYKGGKTFFPKENFESKNEIGDTLIFSGKELEHGVTEVKEGTRFVLSIWFTDIIEESCFLQNWGKTP